MIEPACVAKGLVSTGSEVKNGAVSFPHPPPLLAFSQKTWEHLMYSQQVLKKKKIIEKAGQLWSCDTLSSNSGLQPSSSVNGEPQPGPPPAATPSLPPLPLPPS